MPGGREPTESATENIPPAFLAESPVRVKWCGKSAPRHWQQWWQGKPHSEQDQIGKRSGTLSRVTGEARPVLLPGRSLEACGDACPR